MFESGKSQATDIKEFFGTYKGFTPIDNSLLGYGELELTINESEVCMSKATGASVFSVQFPTSRLVHVPNETIKSKFLQDTNISRYQVFQSDGNHYIFTPDAGAQDFSLIILGDSKNIRGPTIMFSQAQIISGAYEELFSQIGNFIPQLRYDGKMPPKNHQ